MIFCELLIFPGQKECPYSTHKNWPALYALAHINLRILRMGAAGFFSYDEFIQEQDVPEHKTTIKRSDTRTVKQDRSHA